MLSTLAATTADTSPAGGAAIGEVLLATGGAMIATIALVALGFAHRAGRTDLLRRLSNFAAKDTGLAPWAALPVIIATISLIVALVGMYWDISLHIDDGRDAGPLANPAHYLILFGLYGIFAAGFLAIVLPEGKPSRGAIKISDDWYAPLGGVAMMASAAFALIGFPLDDVWHRIFGQDVTLWGPTHLMLIGGAGITLIGTLVLLVEGRDSHDGDASWRSALAKGRRVFAFGGLLIGLSTFQAEFDFGVPQFNFILEPVMLAFAAGVAARRRAPLDRPRRRARRGRVLHRHPRWPGAARRTRCSARRRPTCRSTSPRRRWSSSRSSSSRRGARTRSAPSPAR